MLNGLPNKSPETNLVFLLKALAGRGIERCVFRERRLKGGEGVEQVFWRCVTSAADEYLALIGSARR
jgi:hypothetical protein